MEETANIVGLKSAIIGQFDKERRAVGGGFGPFYERNVIPGFLEIEAAIVAAWIENETVVGFDLFAKKPFHANEVVNPDRVIEDNIRLLD